MKARRWTWTGFLALWLFLAACGNAGEAGGLTITGAWARPAAVTGRAGAAYMLITNSGATDDRLLSAVTDVATTVELHETRHEGGMMAMAPVTSLTIPANGQVELKTGGYHLMLINLTRELKVGEVITLTLTFEEAGDMTVVTEVRED